MKEKSYMFINGRDGTSLSDYNVEYEGGCETLDENELRERLCALAEEVPGVLVGAVVVPDTFPAVQLLNGVFVDHNAQPLPWARKPTDRESDIHREEES